MGFELFQKLKFLKQKMISWRKEVIGNIQVRRNLLLFAGSNSQFGHDGRRWVFK